MKTTRFILPLVALFASNAALHAQVSPVSMRVEQVSKTDTDDKERHKKTQKRSLKVHLSNSANTELSGGILKYWFFGKSVKGSGNETVVLDKGEKGATVPPRKTEIVETPAASVSYTEDHTKDKKKVEGEGNKISGYGAQLVKDGKVLAEYFSSPSFKPIAEASATAKPDAAKKP